eukprot:TRINITY_DN22272_c0_g1_i1.p2 TRINITY_DN22272_c0_g1~~TRINITY_DN22272_c0_g1_i1.p2  ORF type:complete len:561 (+),score=174.36 TRINITY_DN22272_c0_g1_i1:85-1683(+)
MAALQAQRRAFYMGRTAAAWGRAHPALGEGAAEHIGAPFDPSVRLDRDSWSRLWHGSGPLLYAVDLDGDRDQSRGGDLVRCWQRWQRQQSDAAEWERWRKGQREPPAPAPAAELARRDWQRRMWLRRFEAEESWPGRCQLDWAQMGSDTATRLVLWEIYGPIQGRCSPPTAPPLAQYAELLREQCRLRGELAVAELRNREAWAHAVYHAEARNKAPLLAPEQGAPLEGALLSWAKNTVGETGVKEPADAWKDGRALQALLEAVKEPACGGFKVPVPPENVGVPRPEDWQRFLPLARWVRGELTQLWCYSREAFIARARGELSLRREITSRHPRREDGGLAEEVRALDAFARDGPFRAEEWEQALRNTARRAGAPDALALRALPPAGEAPRGRGEQTLQHGLAELLCTPLTKRCLAFATAAEGQKLRQQCYDVARLDAKEQAHVPYAGQATEYNRELQAARRRLEQGSLGIVSSGGREEHFRRHLRQPDLSDPLHRPDPYAHTERNVQVYDHHLRPNTANNYAPPDTSPGVKY